MYVLAHARHIHRYKEVHSQYTRLNTLKYEYTQAHIPHRNTHLYTDA